MRTFLIIILASAFSATADVLESKSVVIAAPSFWCPYACDKNAYQLGFSVEIALEALQSQGIRAYYQNMPYQQAKKQLEAGSIDGIVAAYKGEIRNAIFPQYPVSSSRFCFYSSKEIDFTWENTVDALRPYKLLITDGYSYSPQIDAYIADPTAQVEILKGNDATTRGFIMLARNRANLFLEDAGLYRYILKKGEIDSAINLGCLTTKTTGYLALSPTNSARSQLIADAYDKGFAGLLASGRLQVILDKYNIVNEFSSKQD